MSRSRLFVHSCADGHSGCFHLLPVANDAELDTHGLTPLLIEVLAIILGLVFVSSLGCRKLRGSPTLVGVVDWGLGGTGPISPPLRPQSCLPHVPAARRAARNAVALVGFRTSHPESPAPSLSSLFFLHGGNVRFKPQKTSSASGKTFISYFYYTLSKFANQFAFQQHSLSS